MFLGGLTEPRGRRRVALLLGVLLLAGADGGRIATGTPQDADTAVDGALPSGADGGHPLYLQPPPVNPVPGNSRPLPGTPGVAGAAYGIPVTVLAAYRRAADALG